MGQSRVGTEPAQEWGTDYWGAIESEPTEEHARKVATHGGASVYRRTPAGAWQKEG